MGTVGRILATHGANSTPSTSRPFRRSPMSFPRNAFASLGLLSVAACQTEVFGGQDTYSSRVDTRDYAQEKIDAGARQGGVWGPDQKDPGADSVATFSDAVMNLTPKPASVACLPLVTYDLRTNKPWVSELGLETTDAVARSLREKGFTGQTFATEDVGLRLAQANVARSSYLTLEEVAANAERLGADVVVFGTIKRRDRVGALDRDVLRCELQAYDVSGRRIATSTRWEVPSDDLSYRQAWDMAQAESPWAEDSRYAMPSGRPGLAAELQRISDDLARALGRTIDPAKLEGSMYVAPLDVAAWVPQLVTLRSAQGAFAAEISRRADEARAANAPLDTSGTIVLDGVEYPSFQAAEAQMTHLGTAYQATPAARFAQSFSSGLADALRTRTAPSGRAVNDLAAVGPVDRALIDGELSQGGLGKSFAARDALRAAGVSLVVAPRLERIGDTLQIRVDAYDLAAGAVAGTGTAPIAPALVPELEHALGH